MFTEDLGAFTNPDEMGETAAIVYTDDSGIIGTMDINGIFDEEFVETTINGVPVAGVYPVFGCAVSDLPDYENGTEITIKSVLYKIRNWQPDGTGWTTLILEKQ